MVKRKCRAHRTIFIPTDPTIRQVCIVYQLIPHSHPALPLSRPSDEATELFRWCIQAAGVVGSTVQSIEKGLSHFQCTQYLTYSFIVILAPSTRLLLSGKLPGQVHPALGNRKTQQKIINQEKSKMFPKGLGFEGIFIYFFL
jgi:hypothetical protein